MFKKNEEEITNISEKEEEIIESYNDEEYEEFVMDEEVVVEEIKDKKPINFKILINIFFGLIIALMILTTVDVICIAKYNKGPYFAIPTHTYKDGGSKEYYGIGYKVIKYNQTQGKRNMEIDSWNLKYNTEPIEIKDIELAIKLNDNSEKTYKKYYNKFVRINSTLEKIDKKNNKITLSYKDEGKKYTLDIKCNMASNKKELSKLKEKKEITIIGNIKDFNYKTKEKPNTIYIDNCFAEQ